MGGKYSENGNEKITKNGNETETEKFETETDKFGYAHFRFHCISISRHVTWYGSTNSLCGKSLQCTNKTACIYHYQSLDRALDRPSILEKNTWINILCMLFNGNGNIR